MDAERPFKCEFPDCVSTGFKNKKVLRAHILNVHLNVGKFACAECDSKFSTKNQLKLHKKKHHSTVYTHACPEPDCSWKGFSAQQLKHHARQHKKSACPICEVVFSCAVSVSFIYFIVKSLSH